MDSQAGTVLLLEDDEGVLAVLIACSKRLNLLPLPCRTVEEARNHLAAVAPDVAVIDHHLGAEDRGLDFLIEVQEQFPDCCRILCSGGADPDLLTDAINRGHVDAFLAKPMRAEACLGLLGRGMETARLRRHNRELLAQLALRNADLERSTDELAAAVRERTAHLEDASRRLQDKHHELVRLETQGAIGTLVRGLAHELNNPLASILGYAQRLQRTLSDTEANRRLEVIVSEVDRCRTLVQRLGRLAAPLDEEITVCDMMDVVMRASAKVHEQHGLHCELHIDPELHPVQAGPRSLERVFEQILLNAAQAGANKVTITTTVTNGRIQVTCDNDGATPSDNEISNATRPFFTTRSTTGGRGLGLAIAAGLLREQDGTIILDRGDNGTGARILMSLPPAAGSGRYHRSHRVESHPQVLVVDDEPLISELLADCLTDIGCDVRTVATSAEAWELINKQPLRAIICDMHLHDGTGIDLLRRAITNHPHLIGHVALVTGDVQSPDLRSQASESGMPILTKPFRIDSMTEFVAKLL